MLLFNFIFAQLLLTVLSVLLKWEVEYVEGEKPESWCKTLHFVFYSTPVEFYFGTQEKSMTGAGESGMLPFREWSGSVVPVRLTNY